MNRAICILLTAVALSGTAAEPLTPDAEPNKTGYPTVAAALEALKAKPGTKVTVSEKWTTIEDMEGRDIVLWSFTHPEHPAHPSVVKRAMQARADGFYIDMNVRCEVVDRAACAALVRSFQTLNEKVRQAARDGN
jgi:hypothetical protein